MYWVVPAAGGAEQPLTANELPTSSHRAKQEPGKSQPEGFSDPGQQGTNQGWACPRQCVPVVVRVVKDRGNHCLR